VPPERELAGRLPPQSLEAERSVLGSMLRDNSVIGDVMQIITHPDAFYQDAHQKIFEAITRNLYDQGHPVDLVTLAEKLREKKQLEDCGKAAYLAELWDAAPTAANAEYYARIVRDRAIVRNLIHVSTEILRDAYEQNQPADELLEGAERKILDVAQRGMTGHTTTLEEALADAYDRIDLRHQGEQKTISGLSTGYLDLDEITAGLQNSELIIIAARPSVGKCLAHDSEIVLADGSIATIEEIYRRRSARLLTLGDDWKLTTVEPSVYVDDGIREVYRVTTRLGRQVEATLCHPFLTLDGWRPLSELRVGRRVAVPRVIEVFGNEPMRECEVKLLAYLIGDGCLCDVTPEFSNSNPRLQEDFTLAVSEFGAVKARLEARAGRTPSLHVSGDPAFIAANRPAFGVRLAGAIRKRWRTARAFARALGVSPASVTMWTQGKCVPHAETFSKACALLEVEPDSLVPGSLAEISRSAKNPMTSWLERLGLWDKGAREKFIPASVFRVPRTQLALFLNRLFATDGWASQTESGRPEVGYCSVSERLARQVQHLLLRFGILGRLRRKDVLYQGTRRRAWQLVVTHRESLETFLNEIGIFGKEEPLAEIGSILASRRRKPNWDVIPAEIWMRLAQAKGKESWASLAQRAGLKKGTNIHVGRRGLSRQRLLRLAEALGNDSLRHLAQSDVYWDEIVSIEPAGPKQVYDLTIDGTHNFVANDVCVHNTAFSLNLIRNIVTRDEEAVFFVSLEQSRIELAERLLCSQARVDSHRLRKGHLSGEDMQKLIEAGGLLRNCKLFIDDAPGQGMLRIAANARRLKLRHDIKLVVIDYLQLIEPDNRRDPRQEQVAQISRRLKFLARELNIPVVALAQVNRSSEDRQDHRPRLADLRESGSIEQDADTVMMLHRPDRYEPGQHEGIIEIIIAKQRNGPTGEVTLTYLKEFMRYEDFAVGAPFEG
jgi:replicative DNA helicase